MSQTRPFGRGRAVGGGSFGSFGRGRGAGRKTGQPRSIIRHGIEGLDDLDVAEEAPTTKRARLEGEDDAPTNEQVGPSLTRTDMSPAEKLEYLFGGWENWRAVKKELTAPLSLQSTAGSLSRVADMLKVWRCRTFAPRPDLSQLRRGGNQKHGGKLVLVGGCEIPAYIEATFALVFAMRLDCEMSKKEALGTPQGELRHGEAAPRTPNRSPQGGLAPLDLEGSPSLLGGSVRSGVQSNLTYERVIEQYSYAIPRAVEILLHEVRPGAPAGDQDEGFVPGASQQETYRRRAHEIGMPAELVEARNHLGHGVNRPPLSMLRFSASLAMDWLHENYWVVQERAIPTLRKSLQKQREMSSRDAESLSGDVAQGDGAKSKSTAQIVHEASKFQQQQALSVVSHSPSGVTSNATALPKKLSLTEIRSLIAARKSDAATASSGSQASGNLASVSHHEDVALPAAGGNKTPAVTRIGNSIFFKMVE